MNVWYLFCYGRIRPYVTLIADELHVLQYARYYGVFEMQNVEVALDCKGTRSLSKLIENIIKIPK